jgi:RNA polymerase sigma factor (sigma-70 family)
MKQGSIPEKSRRKRLAMAVVVGTALSAFGSSPASALEANDVTRRAVSAMDRYCTACWRNAHLDPSYWPDCTQEVFTRLLERVTPEAWDRVMKDEAEERREFLRAIDTVKKRSQRSRKLVSSAVESIADSYDPHERRLADDREAVQKAAAEVLSPRQRRILQLMMHGWSVQEVAAELNVAVERVSDEKYKAVHKLRRRLEV